ncbi:DUF1249 domain-containing protein [Entomomonas moraniae]|nr:DUF1249 domain-containing protein [Entomomonas moraniae]
MNKETYAVDLSGLHAIYERNYACLIRLLPRMREDGYKRCFAFTAEQRIKTRLNFSIIENSPYTSYLLLKQDNLLVWLPSPELYIRCYHDAKLAEVVFAKNTRNFKGVYAYPNKAMHQPDEKKQLNQFVEEWLGRCLSSGYEVADTAIKI